MKKVLRLIVILPVFLLMGCDFEKDTYAALKSAEELYAAVYDTTLKLKEDSKITLEQSTKMADLLDVYEGTFMTAKVAYQIWKLDKTESSKQDVVNALEVMFQKRIVLQNAFVNITKGLDGVKTWKELQE